MRTIVTNKIQSVDTRPPRLIYSLLECETVFREYKKTAWYRSDIKEGFYKVEIFHSGQSYLGIENPLGENESVYFDKIKRKVMRKPTTIVTMVSGKSYTFSFLTETDAKDYSDFVKKSISNGDITFLELPKR